jgi:nucleotide-binding universal stress UspA family protein
MLRILIPVDGSDNSLRAVRFLIRVSVLFRNPPEIHLLNVQPSFPGTIRGVHLQALAEHREQGLNALAAARKLFDDAGVKYVHHIGIGVAAETIARYVEDSNIEQVVMGTRGLGAVAGMLLGSVAARVLHLVHIPVLLVP